MIAQYVGLGLAAGLFLYKYRDMLDFWDRADFAIWEKYRGFLRINRDIFIRTIFLTLAFGFFFSVSSAESAMILAVNTILLQYLHWMSYGIDGFAYAAESLVGKYHGAADRRRFNETIQWCMVWGLGLAVLYSATYGLGSETLLSVFTDQQDVMEAARPYLIWMIILPIAGFASYIWDGIFVGMTASVAMRNSMFMAFALFLITYYAGYGFLGAHAIWVAMCVFLFARGAIQWGMFWVKGAALR